MHCACVKRPVYQRESLPWLLDTSQEQGVCLGREVSVTSQRSLVVDSSKVPVQLKRNQYPGKAGRLEHSWLDAKFNTAPYSHSSTPSFSLYQSLKTPISHSPYASCSSTSFAIRPSSLRTLFSTSTILPSHSVQHSLSPSTPSSYHLWIALALLILNSAISLACSSCKSSNFDSRSCNETNEAEASAGGIGRSLIALRREAVVW